MWTPVRDPHLAAALATLGIPFKCDRLLIERSGDEEFHIHFAPCDPERSHLTGAILRDHAAGAIDPQSVLGHMLAACETYQRLRSGRLDPLPGVPPGTPAFRTIDTPAAAALVTLGCTLLAVEGTPPAARWIVATGHPADSPVAALLAHRDGRLSHDHPLVWLLTCLDNCNQLAALRRSRSRRVLLRPPYGRRHALVPERATPAQLDEARRFLSS